MMYRSFQLILSCAASILFAQPVLACATCFVAKKENLMAFFATGVLLSILPFLLVGGVGFWLYRQAKAQNTELPARSDPTTVEPDMQFVEEHGKCSHVS